jgi:hypothetical protein
VAPGATPPLVTQHGRDLINLAQRTKSHQDDVPLDHPGLTQLEGMVSYRVNRPVGKKNRPISVETAKYHVRIIKLFVRWLHRSPSFRE